LDRTFAKDAIGTNARMVIVYALFHLKPPMPQESLKLLLCGDLVEDNGNHHAR
jgi:hypothetical protein